MNANRYTAAMLAELVGVHVSRVRSWQRRGWILPAEQQHRLAYFDFQELTVARQLAELSRLGLAPKTIERKLAESQRRFSDVKRPRAELTLVLGGRTLLVRLGERELAVGAFSGALRSHEAYADAHYHLARTLDDLARGGEALAHWRRFAELSPESPWAEEARERLANGGF